MGPNVTIDKGCIVETGVRLKNVVLMKDVHVKAHSWINNSIVGWRSSIGKWVFNMTKHFFRFVLKESVCLAKTPMLRTNFSSTESVCYPINQ